MTNEEQAFQLLGELQLLGGFELSFPQTEDCVFHISSFLAQANNETTDKLMKAFNLTVGDLPAFPKKDTNLIDLIICIGLAKAKKEAYGQGREDFAVELLKAGAIGEGLKDIINQLK
jgi:hypothetical protein